MMFGDESEICPVTGILFTTDGPQHSTPIKGYHPRRVLSSTEQSEPRCVDARQVKLNRPRSPLLSRSLQTPEHHVTLVSNSTDSRSPLLSRTLQTPEHPGTLVSNSTDSRSPLLSRTLQTPEHPGTLVNNLTDAVSAFYSYPKQVNSTVSCTLQNTIQKQRNEIKLLVSELQDRDRELNETVAAHQQQLLSWERDRQRLLTLEQMCRSLKEKLDGRNRDLKSVQSQLEVSQSEQEMRNSSTDLTEKELERINTEKQEQSQQLNSLQSLNSSLNNSLKAVSGQVGQLEAREQELVTLLRLKEKDICQSGKTVDDLTSRVKQLDTRCQECQHREADALRRATRWKQKYTQAQEAIEKLTCELKKKEEVNQSASIATDIQQQLLMEQESNNATIERDSCNNHLVESLKAKRERMCSELNAVTDALKVGQLEAREQELETLLRLKDKDVSEGGKTVDELPMRVRQLNSRCQLCLHREADALKYATQWKQKYSHAQRTMETLWYEVKRKEEEASQRAAMVTEIQQRLSVVQESHSATSERERYKDQLLESLKAKQERLCDELKTVRELYERQQREVTLLQLNLDSSRESVPCCQRTGDHNSSAFHRDLASEMSVLSGADLSRMSFEDKLSSFLDSEAVVDKSDSSLQDNDVSMPVSPASKLQRLLTESSDLIHSLEQTTIPSSKEMQMENREVDRVIFPVVRPEHRSASEIFTNNQIFQNLSTNSL